MPTAASASPNRSGRAAAMAPEARRHAIVDATLPLLLDRGAAVTTRQIAEAAGVAEGTIFRVFPDKDSVIRAALDRAFDPAPTEVALSAIDRSQSFEDQLTDAVTIVQRRLSLIWQLLETVGQATVPPRQPAELTGLAELFSAHRHELRRDPGSAARYLRALTLAVSHPALVDEPMCPPEIVSLLLDGLRGPGDPGGRS